MTLQQNINRIQTTHIGSLPRPHDLLDLMKAKFAGQPVDQAALDKTTAVAVMNCVRKQVECGIDIVTDGEFSKPGFFTYIQERLEGYEARPGQKLLIFQKETAAFPEYYAQYFKEAMMGGTIVPIMPVVCTGPIKYRGERAVQRDIDNLKGAAKAAGIDNDHVFLPATAPSGVGINEHYKSDEEYFHAVAAALNKEYHAIIASGILLQVDDPFLPDIFMEPDLDQAQMKRRAEIYVEATNAALNGIPAERVRFHTCYGVNEGPRIFEAALADIIQYVLKINAGSYSFEGANPQTRARVPPVRDHQNSGRQSAVPGRDHARKQHCRASRDHRGANPALRQPGGARKRHGGCRLRILLPGSLQDRGPSDGRLGKIQGATAGSRYRQQEALERALTNTRREETMQRFAAFLLGAAVGTAPVLSAAAADHVTLGFMTSLSGPNASVGTEIRDGMQLAVDQLGGKIGGLPARVIIEDDQQKADVARQLAEKFVKSDKVDAVIGFSFSNLMLAVYRPLIDFADNRYQLKSGPVADRR